MNGITILLDEEDNETNIKNQTKENTGDWIKTSEIENPIVEKDIIELADKIEKFKQGKIDEEKFRSLRLARGVYGQRQQGVQMIRVAGIQAANAACYIDI